MKFFSNETWVTHRQDLKNIYGKGIIEQPLERFIVNRDNNKWNYPMIAIASSVAREWPAVGLLDLHDLYQACYACLLYTYNRVDWDKINNSDEPKVRLWKYIKKSVTLDMRHYINDKKDGMKVSKKALWEKGKQKDFFTMLFPQMWFWENDEKISIADPPTSKYDIELLSEGLNDVMRLSLTDTERVILEMSFGIDQPKDEPRSFKHIANYLSLKEGNVRKIKSRSIKKLRTKQIENYLQNYFDFQSQFNEKDTDYI